MPFIRGYADLLCMAHKLGTWAGAFDIQFTPERYPRAHCRQNFRIWNRPMPSYGMLAVILATMCELSKRSLKKLY